MWILDKVEFWASQLPPAPSHGLSLSTVSLLLFLAFIKRVRAKPLGKVIVCGFLQCIQPRARGLPNCDLSPPTPHCAQGEVDNGLQAGVSWGGVIKEIVAPAPILSYILQDMALDGCLLQPCMRVSFGLRGHPCFPLATATGLCSLCGPSCPWPAGKPS